MREAYFEVPMEPTVDPDRLDRIGRLWNSMRVADRLARWRRAIAGLLVVLLPAVLLALRFDRAEGRWLAGLGAAGALSLVTLGRLCWLERRNDRLTDELLAEVRARQL